MHEECELLKNENTFHINEKNETEAKCQSLEQQNEDLQDSIRYSDNRIKVLEQDIDDKMRFAVTIMYDGCSCILIERSNDYNT